MLQISTGMSFRPGAPTAATVHRAALFTNAWTKIRRPIDLPIGRFSFSTPSPVSSTPPRMSALTLEVSDRLETERSDGTPEVMTATHGRQLIGDAVDVFAFAAQVTVTPHRDTWARHLATTPDLAGSTAASRAIGRLFDPAVELDADRFEQLRSFCTRLLALRLSSMRRCSLRRHSSRRPPGMPAERDTSRSTHSAAFRARHR